MRTKQLEMFMSKLISLGKDRQDQTFLADMVKVLDGKSDLDNKIEKEPDVEDILLQMTIRIVRAFGKLSNDRGKRILDIACGSNTSKLPASLLANTPFCEMSFGHSNQGYTALFEPWFCRMLFELGAEPVGIDIGNLENESFQHFRADLGQNGALDFLPAQSFDAVQDSRLFGSPEFTAKYPNSNDRLEVAKEIRWQEQILLKPGGALVHSDAAEIMG